MFQTEIRVWILLYDELVSMLSYTHLKKTRTVQFKDGLEGLHVFSAI